MIVWITGASSGIGEACALEYARQSSQSAPMCLVLTASSVERLQSVAERCREAGAEVRVVACDLKDAEQVATLTERVWDEFGRVDIAFLNAGISQRTTIEDTSMEMVRQIMEVNYFAPVAIAKDLLPRMVAIGGGHIAVTTSIAGLFGFPLRCAYSSSKHALYGFFETLQAENYDRGIRVTIVCPGRVNTPISLRALDKGGKAHGVMDPGQAGGLSAEKAAKQIIRAIRRGKREVYVGKTELMMVYIKRWFPALCAWIGRHISAV